MWQQHVFLLTRHARYCTTGWQNEADDGRTSQLAGIPEVRPSAVV